MSSNYTTGSSGNGRRIASQSSSSSSSSQMTQSYRTSQTIQNPYAKSKTTQSQSQSQSSQKSTIGSRKLSQPPSSSLPSSPNLNSRPIPNRDRDHDPSPLPTTSSFTSSKRAPSSSYPPPASSSSSSSRRRSDLKDLHNALREYCNYSSANSSGNNNNNHHNDVNISFSVASHAIRQRKLLRNISFELKQLAKLNDDYNGQFNRNRLHRNSHRNTHSRDDDDDGQYSFGNDYGGYTSLFLKSTGCSSNDTNRELLSVSTDAQIVTLILRVMDSVSALLLEEYYERREAQGEVGGGIGGRGMNGHDLGVSYVNASASGWNNHNNNNNNQNNGGDNVDSDSLLAILEFLNLAYSCLESNIVYASLQSLIDCEGFRCVDITKLDEDGDDNDNTISEQSDSRTVLDGLLFFTIDPHGNGIIDESNSEQENGGGIVEDNGNGEHSFALMPPSKSKWEPTRIQVLALSALTKAILNVEFVQRYSTSLSLVPEEGIDSLLGNDMGVGLISTHKEDMVRLVEMAMHYLSSIQTETKKDRRHLLNEPPLSPKYQKNDNKLFQLSCMSLLSCLFRTNASEWMLVQVPPAITNKMISILHQCSSNGLNAEANDGEYMGCDSTKFVTSVLAQSLLLIIEWKSPGSTKLETTRDIVDERDISRIIESIFSSKSIHEDSSLICGGSIHLFIHLCIIQDEKLRHIWKGDKMIACIKDQVVQSFTVSDDEDECTNHGIFIAILHFIIAYPQCRQLLNEIFNENEKQGVYGSTTRIGIFIQKALGKGKDYPFSLSVGRIALLKSILLENISTSDELSSKLWNSLSRVQLDHFFNHYFKSYVNPQGVDEADQPMLCAIVDFMGHVCKSEELCSILQKSMLHNDSIIHALISILKGQDTQENDSTVLYGLQLGAACTLGQLGSCSDQTSTSPSERLSKMKSTVRRILSKFEANTLSGENEKGDKSYFGVIIFAINQPLSRDLTRRALNFQSILSSISFGTFGMGITSAIFAASHKKASIVTKSSEQFARYQEQVDRLTEQCEAMTRERDSLEQELANKDAFFQQELVRAKLRSKADAQIHTEILAEEKINLQEKLKHVKAELSTNSKEIKKLNDEALRREESFKRKFDEGSSKIRHLEDQLEKAQQSIRSTNDEVLLRDEKLGKLDSKMKNLERKLDEERRDKESLNHSHKELGDEHVHVKQKLEDSLSKLISLAKAYVSLEKSSLKQREELMSKANDTQSKETELRSKYQRLKEMYRSAEEKVQSLSQKLERAKSSNSQTSKRHDPSSTKRRQPMGTLAFVNSIHDNSIRREGTEKSGRDYSISGSFRSTTGKSRSKKKTNSFRIVK